MTPQQILTRFEQLDLTDFRCRVATGRPLPEAERVAIIRALLDAWSRGARPIADTHAAEAVIRLGSAATPAERAWLDSTLDRWAADLAEPGRPLPATLTLLELTRCLRMLEGPQLTPLRRAALRRADAATALLDPARLTPRAARTLRELAAYPSPA